MSAKASGRKTNDTQIQLRIRGDQRERIIAAAERRNMKLSEFVRWATAEWALVLERQDGGAS
jgi:uncharacterized protein (DUF1778 family)